MTQAQLARALRVQQNVLARLEDGGRADPRLSTVVAVARALGVSVDALLVHAGIVSQPPTRRAAQQQILEVARAARAAREELSVLDAALAQVEVVARPARTAQRRKTTAGRRA